MKHYAVIGKNIDYSLSPTIHMAHFNALNIEANYELLNLNELDINYLRQLNGFNVTIPFKEKIYAKCDVLSDEAVYIGAVNCVKVISDQFFGYNTDVYGFYQLLIKNDLLEKHKKVLVIGAGGAAKAIHYCLKKYTTHEVYMTNRTDDKVKLITTNRILFQDVSHQLKQFDMVINCTNVGVKDDLSPIKVQEIKENAVFIDINYQSKSPFLVNAKKLNAKTINGLDMLIYQAVKSFEIWFMEKALVEVMYYSIRKG